MELLANHVRNNDGPAMNRISMKRLFASLLPCTSLMLVVACSSTVRKDYNSFDTPAVDISDASESKVDAGLSDEEQKAIIEESLAQMVKEAKEGGPEAIEYVSTDLYLKASDASLRGDAASAALLYQYLLELQPKDQFLKKKFTVELIRLGQFAAAEKPIRELYDDSKGRDEGLGLILGGVYTALEKKEEAFAVYKQIHKDHPKSEEACIFLSKQYSMREKREEAINVLAQCQKRAPKKAVFSYYMGKTAVQFGMHERALKYFTAASKIDPNFYQAVLALGLFKEEKKDFESALAIYKKFLSRVPDSFPVLSRAVQIMFALGKMDEVIPFAERLTTIDPSDLNLKVRLGILYTDHKRYDDAKGIFKEILLAVPDSDKILYYLASLYQQTDELEKAVETFSRIPTSSNLYMDGSFQVAQILSALALEDYERGDEEKVERYLSYIDQKTEELPKIKVELQVNMASFFEAVGETDKAIAALRGVSKEENFTESHLYYFASLLEKKLLYGEAEAAIRALLVKNPNNAHALNFLGYSILERGGDMDEAHKLISRAVELKPEDGYIRDSLGWYYYKVGKVDMALEHVEKAWSLVKNDTVINKHLAILHQEMKNYAKAKKYYLEALRFCKVEEEKVELIKRIEDLSGSVEKRLPASAPAP